MTCTVNVDALFYGYIYKITNKIAAHRGGRARKPSNGPSSALSKTPPTRRTTSPIGNNGPQRELEGHGDLLNRGLFSTPLFYAVLCHAMLYSTIPYYNILYNLTICHTKHPTSRAMARLELE